MPDPFDDLKDLRMHHRLTARYGDHRRTKLRQFIDPLQHNVDRHRIARLVILIAVSACEIAPPHRHDVHENGVLGRRKGTGRVPHAPEKPACTACLRHNVKL